MSTRTIAFTRATAAALLALTATAYAAPPTATRSSAKAVLPAPDAAKTIVRTLWSRRELALKMSDARTLDTFATASAKAHDSIYIRARRSGREGSIGIHPLNEVIPQIPKESTRPVFFAQVRTTNPATHRRVWYVVAVERGRDGRWRFAFVSFGGRDGSAPLLPFTRSDSYTPRMTEDSFDRIARQAATVVHGAPPKQKDGIIVQSRGSIGPPGEGVYGLELPSGDVLSCFTWHVIGTYTYPSGVLEQAAPDYLWGPLLEAGSYSSVTIDQAVAQCTVGIAGKDEPQLLMQDATRMASASGVRA